MSSQVEGVHPRLAEHGSSVGENEEEGGPSTSHQSITKIRIIGPAANRRASRGLTRAIRRPSDYTNLHTENNPNQPLFDTDMTIAAARTAQQPIPETEDDEDLDDSNAVSPLLCETPIPPLPRARIPSRLGSVSAQTCEPQELGEPHTQGMILIGRPASTASYNRMSVPLDDHRRGESGPVVSTSSGSFLSEGQEMSGRITSLEEHLKPLLLCQSMGVKIETKTADFIPGKIAQIVFHCQRCLKHWKLSGKPKSPSECKERHQPTRGPEYNISMQSHRIMQELKKLPECGKQQLIEVLSRTGSPGADEELLELVNSASSGFSQESSSSPHASRRSRSPEKRGMMRLSTERNSPSPGEKFHRADGQHKEQRSRSATHRSESIKPKQEARSTKVKSLKHNVHGDTKQHQRRQEPVFSLEEHFGKKEQSEKEDKVNTKEHEDPSTGNKEEEMSSNVREPAEEHAKADESLQNNLDNSQLTPRDQPSHSPDMIEPLTKKPEHPKIPIGETSATGQSIIEFEDIDGTRYHGFIPPSGNFVPIAQVDHTGNRLPIVMKPDGGICIIRRGYSSQALDPSSDDSKKSKVTANTDKGIIEVRDRTGAIVLGYKNLSGQFVPIARIDDSGLQHPVMMKTDGKFYVKSNDDDDCHEVVIISDTKLGGLKESNESHPSILSRGQTMQNCQKVQERFEHTRISEVESHDGYKYQGFESPGIGFIPTARVDPDGTRRPVVMNAEGEYTVVNGDGMMIDVHLRCRSNDYRGDQCTGCRFHSGSHSQSMMLLNTLSKASSGSNDNRTFISASQKDVRIGASSLQTDLDSMLHVDHLVKTGRATPSERSHKFRHMTYKRERDGSVYHGRCQSGRFVPVFRLDETGCRYPVLTDSGGKYYTIGMDGQNQYTDEYDSTNKVVTHELNGYTFEGRHTIDGRFVPMSYLDDHGNRKALTQSRSGQYIFSGKNGDMNFVKFKDTDKEVNPISAFNTNEKATKIRVGDDGLKYEGYIDINGKFIPTVRMDKSGYRQMVLKDEKDQGYVVSFDGQVELVPFIIPQRSPKLKTKSKKFSQTPFGKSTKSKHSYVSADDESALPGSIIASLSHLRIKSGGSNLSVKDSEGDSSNKQEDDHDLPFNDGLNKLSPVEVGKTYDSSGNDHGTESQGKGARILSGISSKSHQDGTVIYRRKSTSKEVENVPKQHSLSSHSDQIHAEPDEPAAPADGQRKDRSKSAGVWNDKRAKYLRMKDDPNVPSFKEAAEHVVDIKETRDQREVKAKPIVKNTAVRNVTGRPDTKAGQFMKHVFVTPRENLTNAVPLRKMTGKLDSDTTSNNAGDTSELSHAKTTKLHPSQLSSEDGTKLQPSELSNREGTKLQPSELANAKIDKLPSSPQKPGLPSLSQSEREVNSETKYTSSEQGSDNLSLALNFPQPETPSDQANASPPVKHTRRKSKTEEAMQKKVGSENRQRASKAPSADFSPEVETNQANDAKDQRQSPADLLNKYSNFKLTVDPPLSPQPPLPPLPSDKELTYRMTYPTSPSHFQSLSPSPQSTSSVLQTSSSKQGKLPEPILFTTESSKVQVSTLPLDRDEVPVSAPRVASPILMKELLQTSKSIDHSQTSLDYSSLNHMHGARGRFPKSINKKWQQHKLEVEFLRQTFRIPLTRAFTFSMFELPEQYAEHNSTMMQKAKVIQKMKKPTKLGKPPPIMQKLRHPPSLKIKKPLETIPYRMKAKMAKA